MRKSQKMFRSQRGFTLVEMAVVLVIAGALLGAGLKLLNVQSERAAISVTQKHQETIKQALITYLGRMSRLPCPDTDSPPEGVDDNRDAAGACTSFFGRVPYLDLGLDRATVLDGWDNYITYVVSPRWTLTYNPAAAGNIYQTNIMANAFWPGVRIGGITVSDRFPWNAAALTVIANAGAGTGDALALISHGKTGMGAFNTGNIFNDIPPGVDERANVNIAGLSIISRDINEVAGPGGQFDDIVMSVSPTEMITPLVNSGAVQSASPAAVLNEVNDFVVGQIIGSKRICGVPPAPAACPVTEYYYTVPAAMGLGLLPNALGWNAIYVGTPLTAPASDYMWSGYPAANEAYRIGVDGGALPKIVNMQELKGILAHTSGFN
ncbi:MAG: prepilin-type N-terminal cleavage/methylation domain-containing protein [Methylophilaceae bacterium]